MGDAAPLRRSLTVAALIIGGRGVCYYPPMFMPPGDLLQAVAATLRRQVGPEVADPFARTQAFMAAVVLEKLAGQLRASEATHEAAAAECAALLAGLAALSPASSPALARAMEALAANHGDANWCTLVEALHGSRDALGPAFEPLLARVRVALRSRLDRALVYAS